MTEVRGSVGCMQRKFLASASPALGIALRSGSLAAQ
jgi:hypothetical protein